MSELTGIVLAAGAGSRMGTPKALVRTAEGEPWLHRAIALLLQAGCSRVLVVLGAAAAEARLLVPADARVEVVVAEDWERGMSASLAAGLAAASGTAAIITLVDTPELPPSVVDRVLSDGTGAAEAPGPQSLRQAVFSGRPGHPVLIGAAHWSAVLASLDGDRGARAYLSANQVREIECGDLFDGHDIDLPPRRGRRERRE